VTEIQGSLGYECEGHKLVILFSLPPSPSLSLSLSLFLSLYLLANDFREVSR